MLENKRYPENNPESQAHYEENEKEFTKQCKIVHDALLRGEKLTTHDALLKYNIGDLRRRVKDLKDIYGIPVLSRYVTGTRFKEYFL
ncbi:MULTISPECIES: hypothetical protein [unclassified Myroides]|uniref:hypothetical protein n=1 Tax=unclassified Myroides TaxID=2642485 RepID=UPI003D2F99C3